MTTNASLLGGMAVDLATAGLSLLRISWHTTDPGRFRQISGHGDYATFKAGVEAAAQAGINISFNRVLFRDSARDLPEQLDFIEQYGLRLKLYDLMWTPELDPVYRQTYQDWRPVIREHVLPRTKRIERLRGDGTRNRIRFHLRNRGMVEVKVGDTVNRTSLPCATCAHRGVCLEQFGDYLRVEPELDAYACYLRRDIGFNMNPILEAGETGPSLLRSRIRSIVNGPEDNFFRHSRLRYIVVPYCNFNCVIPGTNISWCHKTSGDYSFPGRPRSVEETVLARTDTGKSRLHE